MGIVLVKMLRSLDPGPAMKRGIGKQEAKLTVGGGHPTSSPSGGYS